MKINESVSLLSLQVCLRHVANISTISTTEARFEVPTVVLPDFQTFGIIMPCRLNNFANNFSGSDIRVKRPKRSSIRVLLIPK